MELSKNQKEIIKHTVLEPGRNWFGTSKGYTDANDFDDLVLKGLAIESKPPSWSGDTALYRLTDEGKAVAEKLFVEEKEALPKQTKGQKRYKAYLSLDNGQTFGEFLKDPFYKEYRTSCGC